MQIDGLNVEDISTPLNPPLIVDSNHIAINESIKQRNKGGRPLGSSGLNSKQPSAIARAFKAAGLDWKTDFALAIKANKRERIALWLRLLPYLITTGKRAKVKKWKGRASKAALVALEAMEQDV